MGCFMGTYGQRWRALYALILILDKGCTDQNPNHRPWKPSLKILSSWACAKIKRGQMC